MQAAGRPLASSVQPHALPAPRALRALLCPVPPPPHPWQRKAAADSGRRSLRPARAGLPRSLSSPLQVFRGEADRLTGPQGRFPARTAAPLRDGLSSRPAPCRSQAAKSGPARPLLGPIPCRAFLPLSLPPPLASARGGGSLAAAAAAAASISIYSFPHRPRWPAGWSAHAGHSNLPCLLRFRRGSDDGRTAARSPTGAVCISRATNVRSAGLPRSGSRARSAVIGPALKRAVA